MNLTVDYVKPTATLSTSRSALKIGETATITVQLSEASSNFILTDVTVTGGTLGTFVAVSSTQYTFIFTPDSATNAGSASLSLATGAFTDAAGNTSSASFTVTVNDTQNPTITAPVAVTVSANASCNAFGVTLGTPTTADNCGVASVTNNAPGTFPLGNTTVTWTVTDNAGNTATATQVVTVVDNTNPTIVAPANLTVNANANCQAVIANLGNPIATDNCTVVTVTNNAPATFPLGNTTVTWTATDGHANTATATQIITVVDNSAPVIAGIPANITVGNTTGSCNATVTWTAPTATDNCAGVTLTTNHASGSVFSLGTTTVTYTATDAAGNGNIAARDVRGG